MRSPYVLKCPESCGNGYDWWWTTHGSFLWLSSPEFFEWTKPTNPTYPFWKQPGFLFPLTIRGWATPPVVSPLTDYCNWMIQSYSHIDPEPASRWTTGPLWVWKVWPVPRSRPPALARSWRCPADVDVFWCWMWKVGKSNWKSMGTWKKTWEKVMGYRQWPW